jgi:HEAT repeat protein
MDDQIDELIEMLEAEESDLRLNAIQILGEIGDQHALAALRKRMARISTEHQALVIAVGKLKRKLGVR